MLSMFDHSPPAEGHNSATAAPRRSNISKADLEAVFWRHRLKFRENYLRADTPFWKHYVLEILATDRSCEEKVIGIVLALHADENSGENAYPSIDRIGALTSLSRKTVIKYVATLRKDGWVTEEKGKGRASNSYTVTIPQKTIDELVEKFGAARNGNVEARSGGAHPPLDDRSGGGRTPQTNGVVVEDVHHKSRSGGNRDRSGGGRTPDLRDTISLKESALHKKRAKTRLPDDWTLPPEYRAYAATTHGLTDRQIDGIAIRFHRYWTGDDAKGDGKKADWLRTWQNWVDDAVARGVPADPKRNGRDDALEKAMEYERVHYRNGGGGA
jgi:biotin operon repressor